MQKTYVTELVPQCPVTSCFLASNVRVRTMRGGGRFLSLTLGDRTGRVPAVLWKATDEAIRQVTNGDVLKVRGLLSAYHDQPQFVIERLRRLPLTEVHLDQYFPHTLAPPETLLVTLDAVVSRIETPALQALCARIFATPEIRHPLGRALGAKYLHHATLGGLLEHLLAVVRLCQTFADQYPLLNRDLLVTAALLHDLGKLPALTWHPTPDYTPAGRLLGHITLGVTLVQRFLRDQPDLPADLATQLLHCLISHHGSQDHGSPVEPMTLEALALHMADNLDAKLNLFTTHASEAPDPQHPGWTQYQRGLGRSLYLPAVLAPAPATPAPAAPATAA